VKAGLLTLLSVCLVTALPHSAAARSAATKLPDLGVAPLEHMLIETTSDGKKRLRFTTSIANVGAGPIEIVASRRKRGTNFAVSQRIRRADGSAYLVATPDVRMVFEGGESHGHWHARGVVRYELRRLGDLTTVKIRLKRGFCFYDSRPYRRSLPAAPKSEVYPRGGCGKKTALEIKSGLSVGWLDVYYWRIPGQEMDVTALPNGKYRLFAKADPKNWFQERNERNNATWVDLQIGPQLVKVLGRGPRI
jgi:lysyl oxidase